MSPLRCSTLPHACYEHARNGILQTGSEHKQCAGANQCTRPKTSVVPHLVVPCFGKNTSRNAHVFLPLSLGSLSASNTNRCLACYTQLQTSHGARIRTTNLSTRNERTHAKKKTNSLRCGRSSGPGSSVSTRKTVTHDGCWTGVCAAPQDTLQPQTYPSSPNDLAVCAKSIVVVVDLSAVGGNRDHSGPKSSVCFP